MHKRSPEFYRNALEILEWGSNLWKDVPSQDRGMIFEATFIRAVKRLYLKSLMEVRRHAKLSSLPLSRVNLCLRHIDVQSLNVVWIRSPIMRVP